MFSTNGAAESASASRTRSRPVTREAFEVAAQALVTGAGGFIASHLCERLVRDGVRVRALCRYTSRREIGNLAEAPEGTRDELEILFGDLLDRDFVAKAVAGCETVYHLAASISVPYSFIAPREVVRTNVEGTLNVLTAAQDSATAQIVHVSSSEVYGTARYTPIDEGHPLHVQSPYAASKVGADKLAESFFRALGVPVVIARPFNTYGPRQSLRAVIPTIIAQALDGNEVKLGATSPTRDFVYVTDTVDALVRLAGERAAAGETFNIARGTDVSIEHVVELIGELLGRELRIESRPERLRPRASEVFQLCGDASKLRQLVSWEPATSLRDGLAAVIDWMTKRRPRLAADTYVV
jgi:NAD dependent epimerase/dehydratase